MPTPDAPANLRNCLNWRGGRPRWEPSPSFRKAGFKGLDLKDGDAWMERGAAISAADARHKWAALIREAMQPGPEGERRRELLGRALDVLPPLNDAADRKARALVQDLIELGRAVVDLTAVPSLKPAAGRRTVEAMIDGYFADPSIAKAEGTRRVYRAQKQRILARFGRRRVDEITRGELRSWYVEMVNETTISAANLASAAFGAFFKWAMWQDWITDSPATKLGRTKAKGRVVYITLQEELAFVAFCDANGFADVGDGLTLCVWTGASPVDACKLNLADLSADTWRFSRQKTGVEALPAFLPVVKARADRRRSQTVVGAHGAFLIDHLGKRHTPASLGRRFREARALAVVADVVPASFAHKRLQDARDTCVTRLADADVPFMKIWPWTGHSPKDAEAILRGHYLYLREEGAMETAAHLQAWAEKNRLPLA